MKHGKSIFNYTKIRYILHKANSKILILQMYNYLTDVLTFAIICAKRLN